MGIAASSRLGNKTSKPAICWRPTQRPCLVQTLQPKTSNSFTSSC